MTEALWTYKREPAGMGEWCYRVYRNGVYWFYLEDSNQAMIVVNALNRDAAKSDAVLVFEYPVHLPLKSFRSITRRKLALNDIGENEDGFTRINFELKDGDVIQVLRTKERER